MHQSMIIGRRSLGLKVLVSVALVLTFGMGSVRAGQLQIGPTANGPYTDFIYQSQHVISVGGPGDLYVFHTASSGTTLQLPSPVSQPGLLLLLGIPNDSTNGSFFTSNPITSGNGSLSTHDLFGGTWNTTTHPGYAGLMTKTGDEAYTMAGIGDKANNSNSFQNWQAADQNALVNGNPLGVTANNFGLYVFEIDPATLNGTTQSVKISFASGSLPLGTFIIAYGQEAGTTDKKGKFHPGAIFDTPFTQAGLTTGDQPFVSGVPAPPSAVLLGLGGLGLAFLLVRSRCRLAVAA